jgi:hypothetical protein
VTAPSTPRTSDAAGAQRSAKVYRLHFARDWISRDGPQGRRKTTIVFTLRKPSIVLFVVRELAPACRRAGSFRVLGRRGVNRIRFRGRIGRRLLPPGTYRIDARTLPGRRTVARARFVIVGHPSRDEIARARRADVCGSGAGRLSEEAGSVAGSNGQASAGTSARSGPAGRPADKDGDHGVLGTRFTRFAGLKDVPGWIFAFLAGVAVALLGIAALPQRAAPSRRLALALEDRRAEIAFTGVALLAGVMFAYVLS